MSYKLIPWVVRGTLVKSSLLFLGFPLDDWAFRVIFRLIMSFEGSGQLSDYAHVGVQVDPAEHDLADGERAREYLQEYFGTGDYSRCVATTKHDSRPGAAKRERPPGIRTSSAPGAATCGGSPSPPAWRRLVGACFRALQEEL